MEHFQVIRSTEYLEHHGIKGMHWGIRRYQNDDGSLTDAGKKHYGRNYDYYKKKEAEAGKEYRDIYTKTAKKYFRKDKMSLRRYNKLSTSEQYGHDSAINNKVWKDKKVAKAREKATEAIKKREFAQQYRDIDYEKRKEKLKKVAKNGAIALTAAVAAVGAYKINKGMYKSNNDLYKVLNNNSGSSIVSSLADLTMDDLKKLDLY